jgi:hypothetical protein
MYEQYGTRSNAPERLQLRHLLAGVQASVLGVLLMFAWLALASLFRGRSVWVVPNLFSTTFFGGNAYRNEFLRTSWAGVALTVAVYGLVGALWGGFWRDRSPRWLTLYGAITGFLVYLIFYDFVWRHWNPLVSLYAPDHQLEIGHLLWGMVLARSPIYARRIVQSMTDTIEPPPSAEISPTPPPLPAANVVMDGQAPHDQDQEDAAPEVKSGEVIL